MRFPALLTCFALGAGVAQAQEQIVVPADYRCSVQILVAVDRGMPSGLGELQPERLTCLGLAQVYTAMTDPEMTTSQARRAVEAVFRREGLSR